MNTLVNLKIIEYYNICDAETGEIYLSTKREYYARDVAKVDKLPLEDVVTSIGMDNSTIIIYHTKYIMAH